MTTRRRFTAALCFFASSTLPAQTRDPLAEAKALFDARTPATKVAGTLKRDHARTVTQASTILRTVGYAAAEVVPALRAEFTSSASAIYEALRVAGYDQRGTGDAMVRDGFVLTCIDPQGHAVPCGAFGGNVDAPVMGQLTVHPAPEGQVSDKLYITGTNIPPVFVRLGSAVLVVESASASAIVARLPASQVVGDLSLVRKSDNVSGVLQKDYRVVAPPLAWSNWAQPAGTGAIEDMHYWLQGAQVLTGCGVDGPLATLIAGAFTSATGFSDAVRTRLVAAGAPIAIADAWNNAFRQAFDAYTSQVIAVPPLVLYPSFAAVASAKAGPMPNVAMALGAFTSLGGTQMLPPALAIRVKTALGAVSPDSPARTAAVDGFATMVGGMFANILLTSHVVNLMGEGPVPGYGTAGVGKVTGGTCKGTKIVMLKP